jgi:hypothetical protein
MTNNTRRLRSTSSSEADELTSSDARVNEHTDDGRVAHVLKATGLAGREQRSNVVLGEHVDRLLWHGRSADVPHRSVGNLAFFDQEVEELPQARVTHTNGRRGTARGLQ